VHGMFNHYRRQPSESRAIEGRPFVDLDDWNLGRIDPLGGRSRFRQTDDNRSKPAVVQSVDQPGDASFGDPDAHRVNHVSDRNALTGSNLLASAWLSNWNAHAGWRRRQRLALVKMSH